MVVEGGRRETTGMRGKQGELVGSWHHREETGVLGVGRGRQRQPGGFRQISSRKCMAQCSRIWA